MGDKKLHLRSRGQEPAGMGFEPSTLAFESTVLTTVITVNMPVFLV